MAFRAFARSRKSGPSFAGTFTAPDQLRVEADESIQTAGVTCKPCNNGWLSLIDNDAADAEAVDPGRERGFRSTPPDRPRSPRGYASAP